MLQLCESIPHCKKWHPVSNRCCCCGVIWACFAFPDPFNCWNERRGFWLVGGEGYTKTSQSERGADSGGKSRACLRLHGPELAAVSRSVIFLAFPRSLLLPVPPLKPVTSVLRKTGGGPKNDLMRQTGDGGTGRGGGGGGTCSVLCTDLRLNRAAHRRTQYAVSVGQVRRARVPAGVGLSG